MAQQFPPNGGRGGHGGRGPSPGGRGAGRGIPPQQQPQPQPYNFAAGGSGRGGSRTGMGAWQPAQPTSSLQQAAAYSGPPPSQPPQNRPPPGGYASMGVGGMAYYNPYASGGNQAFVPRTDPNHHYQGQHTYAPAPHQQQATRGVVYYPPTVGPPVGTIPQVPMPQSQMPQPPAPREKKPLIITVRQIASTAAIVVSFYLMFALIRLSLFFCSSG